LKGFKTERGTSNTGNNRNGNNLGNITKKRRMPLLRDVLRTDKNRYMFSRIPLTWTPV
jgi:hypothetical protein